MWLPAVALGCLVAPDLGNQGLSAAAMPAGLAAPSALSLLVAPPKLALYVTSVSGACSSHFVVFWIHFHPFLVPAPPILPFILDLLSSFSGTSVLKDPPTLLSSSPVEHFEDTGRSVVYSRCIVHLLQVPIRNPDS